MSDICIVCFIIKISNTQSEQSHPQEKHFVSLVRVREVWSLVFQTVNISSGRIILKEDERLIDKIYNSISRFK